ncbi:MAG: fimbrial biogenesis outer membrane usher protein [Nitrospirae bacterium]|nr:fimbrial biogenesis outer membrane usher protein [Nitrospirota bacterium]
MCTAVRISALEPQPFSYEKIAITIYLNGEEKGEAFIAITPDNNIFLLSTDLKELGIIVSGKEAVIEETAYVSLRSLMPHLKFQLNEKYLRLDITAEPGVFEGNTVDLQNREVKGLLYPGDNSAFVNYGMDLGAKDDFDFNSLNIPSEVGIRLGEYLIFSNFSYNMERGGNDKFIRLFSNITRDDTKSMIRYIAGDFNASTGELGGGATLGGISISKNYSLNPYFLRYPGIDLSGLLYTTSDVELWADGRIVSKQRLSPGSFEFENVPLTAGIGEAEIVIRDAFGKEQRIVVPFYFSSLLLKKGFHEYSYNAGFLRGDFGNKNFDYEKPSFLMTHRYGLTDRFTAGIRAEANPDVLSSGVSSHFVIEKVGIFDAALAYSLNHTNGRAYSLGYSFNTKSRGLNLRLTIRGYSKGYSNLTLTPDGDKPRTEILSSAGYSDAVLGSLTLFYASSDNYLSEDSRKFTIRYTRKLYRDLSLEINASNTQSNETENAVFVTFRYIFGNNTIGSLTSDFSSGEAGINMNIQKTPEDQRGIGYNLYYENKGHTSDIYDTELTYAGRYGIYSGKYRISDSEDTSNLKVSGSIAMVNGSLHLGQPISDSFAVVRVGDLKDISIYCGNTLTARTDGRGEAFIPRIQSYNANKIFVNEKDMPLSYTMGSFTKHIFPMYRSGSYIEFKPEKMQAVTGNIFILDAGEKKPAEFWSLIVNVKDSQISSPIVNNGEFYLENIPSGNYTSIIKKGERQCRFELIVPEGTEPVINIGDILCNL